VLKDSGFLTVRNLSNIVLQTAPVTIMAIGLVFVLSAGEIDLSIGSRRSLGLSAPCREWPTTA
jgi:ribose transport system permease protein